MELNKIYNEDCHNGIKRITDTSIDCILTDPPYLYLKNQKLDRPFDENTLFLEFKRVLKPTGFVVLFGRGTSFYRWNTILADLGFAFKEEIVWDKIYSSSPVTPLQRKHELISIHTIGKGTINKVKIPYLEMNKYDYDKVVRDMKRLCSAIHSEKGLNDIISYIETGDVYTRAIRQNGSITVSGNSTRNSEINKAMIKMVIDGNSEQSIIRQVHDRYNRVHLTQKPVRLIERLLALTTIPGNVVLDPFSGSCSTAIACVNTNRKYIGFEIDKEYYEAGIKRLNEVLSNPKLAM
ncbi:DNA-methyltransferase [Bacteroides fragilis]